MWYRHKGFRVFVWSLCIFVTIDVLFFRFLLWHLPNESAWSSQPHYNFEYKLKNIKPGEKNDKLILVTGSSVALYSILTPLLEKQLNEYLVAKDLPGYRIRMLAHQGMTPFHLDVYLNRIFDLNPAIILYATHPVDLRLERPLIHQNANDLVLAEDSDKRKKAIYEYVHSVVSNGEFRIASPIDTIRNYHSFLERHEISRLALAGLLAGWRYKSIVLDAYNRMLENHFSNARHYHTYAGLQVQGITHRGWVSRKFSFRANKKILNNGWILNAPRSLFLNKQSPRLVYRVYSKNQTGRSFEEFLKPGWQKIKLHQDIQNQDIIHASVSEIYYDSRSDDYLSIRFTRNFGMAIPKRRLREVRPLRREDRLYQNYSDQRYKQSFDRRLLNFDRKGTEYLRAIKNARIFWSAHKFDPRLPPFQIQKKIINKINKKNIKLILINTPENPISAKWFGSRRWYNGYVDFLKKNRGSLYRFYDFQELLPMQDFYDYHHLTWYGAQKMTREVLSILNEHSGL